MSTAAVLLAAGGGTRYDGPTHKLRAVVGDRMVVEWSLAAVLGAGLDELIVVTGAADLDDVLPASATRLHNPAWVDGQASSLALALDHLDATEHEAMVVGLADQPGVGSGCWRAVAEAPSPLARATYDGRWGHPARIHRSLWGEIERTGDAGARALFAGRSADIEAVPCRGRPDDIDTVEDLARWN